MATPDPCAALFGSVKQACENMGKTLNGGSGSGGVVGNLLGLNYNGAFDWRHFVVRIAEFGIGITLVMIAANAGLKPAVMANPVVKSTKQIVKKVK
jgi:hypothetical protein